MSILKNEPVTETEKPVKAAEKWLATTASAVESVYHDKADDFSSAMKRGWNSSKSASKRFGNKADTVINQNPYPTALVGIGAGTLIGILLAWCFNGRHEMRR